MSRTSLINIAKVAVILVGSWIAYTQTQTKAPPLSTHKIKDDLYEIEGDGGNVTVYITNEGVILVDDKYDQDHEAIVSEVKNITNQPVKYILSTHHHADHSGGNAKFLPNTQIISTTNAHKNIVEHKQGNAPPGMMAGQVSFTTEASVYLGGKEVQARYFGRGHTNGDAMIYFPLDRTLSTGDMMAGNTPLIDYPGGGSLKSWPDTMNAAIKEWDFDTVIPGHGPVTNKAGLQAYSDNVAKERTRVAGLVKEGKSQEDIGKVMMAEYGWAANSLQMQWSLPGLMTEFK